MKNSSVYPYLLLVACSISIACEEDPHYRIFGDEKSPRNIAVSEISPRQGGAVIHYKIPPDPDLLYIEANYTLANGRKMMARTSKYIDSIRIEGFGKEGKHVVLLHTVDKGKNVSKATRVEVPTLPPPISLVYQTLKLSTTFGGLNLKWKNEKEAPMAFIMLVRPDSMKDRGVPFDNFETLYDDQKEGNKSLRGFGNVEHEFAVMLRDRWDNLSDTLKASFTPLEEENLDSKKFEEVRLPGDIEAIPYWNPRANSQLRYLWDRDKDDIKGRAVFQKESTVKNGSIIDGTYHFTMDLGVTAKLSRMKFWQFNTDNWAYLYFDAQVEEFEVWGHPGPLDLKDGSFKTWELLIEHTIVKASGMPKGRGGRFYSARDKADALAGHDIEFSLLVPEVRYIRIKIKKTFSDLDWASIGEIDFWGKVIKKQ